MSLDISGRGRPRTFTLLLTPNSVIRGCVGLGGVSDFLKKFSMLPFRVGVGFFWTVDNGEGLFAGWPFGRKNGEVSVGGILNSSRGDGLTD